MAYAAYDDTGTRIGEYSTRESAAAACQDAAREANSDGAGYWVLEECGSCGSLGFTVGSDGRRVRGCCRDNGMHNVGPCRP